MKTFKGISASPGIVIGKVFLYVDDAGQIPKYTIPADQVDTELERFFVAAGKAAEEIRDLQAKASLTMRKEESKILDSHVLMLSDPEFTKRIEESIRSQLLNAEWVLYTTINQLVEPLENSADTYLRERTIDIRDVAKRVYNHLLYRDRINLSDLDQEVILVTHDLLPSDALAMNKQSVKGIAMDAGGKTSHTAILARSFEIPAVLGLSSISSSAATGDAIIIDGTSGTVLLKPDQKTLTTYEKRIRAWQKREVELLTLNELPAETRDGKRIVLKANIEVPEETESAIAHGAEGIGLYRSEFLFLQPGGYSSEDVQYEAYARVLKAMAPYGEVTIRTLDVGGDKVIPGVAGLDEKNPILGWRAVRFCLSRKDLFRTQLRAMLRASVHGRLRIMFPMISGIEELENVLALLDECRQQLREENIPFAEDIPVGIMIEVPSAALTADILARKVDFFSIGTNDLIQYTIAVDRGNEKIAYLYEPFHPGVLRLLKRIIEDAHNAGIPVAMCGEVAGDPYAAVILLGFGLDVFSMSSFGIPEVKKIIRSVSMSEAEELVGTIMEMKSYKEIDSYVRSWMNERFDLAVT
ncbi:phosphoenolpyruvate--protein phosphotransferase [Sediminispirochaeta bajacaliforniensis]|uniref:phosphoenolpyruvate--protein phosphotransferase n=1 Tax=Sediminispirochaeta bajacaliforniensis TaxID=148 RepID=UPI0003651396|nr:phosphoenolpyruvate--protein phosphotransferase [Sediminispirochaeta bajacaliforniensis]